MEKIENIVAGISRLFDRIAGWGIVAVMLLVVVNILLRLLFKSPILGVYEYVGFMTALVIGLALAYCAVQNAHIAIGFVLDKLSLKTQAIVDIATKAVVLIFLGFSCIQVAGYAKRVAVSGEVSPTTQTPFYPFIFIVALGLLVLCLVILVQFIKALRRVVGK